MASGKSEDSKAPSQTETLRWKHKMWEVRSVWARSWRRKKNKNKETCFGCIFFSRIVYQSLPVECLPTSIIQSKERADMALVATRQCGIPVYMQTWAKIALKASWPGTVLTRWEYYKGNKRISFPDFWLKAFPCGKVGWGNGRIDWGEEGKFNSPEACIADLVALWRLK